MSASLSNLSIFLPISSERNAIATPSLNQLRYPQLMGRCQRRSIKAMAAERRDSLDHLQKATNRQPTQAKQRVAQVPTIGIWDRFPTASTVQQMLDTMDRIMEDPFAYNSSMREGSGGGYGRGRTPWEIREGEDEYKMRFDMPGMTKKDVKVSVEEKMLVVKAEKQLDEEEEVWSAKSYGRYSSRIALPENIESEKIKAEVKDGVLYIIIPKAKTTSKVLDIAVQ